MRLFKNAYFLCFLGGLFYALGFPSLLTHTAIPIGPILGLMLLFHSTDILSSRKVRIKRLLLLVTCFCYGYYFLGFYWIPFTIKEFGGIPTPLNHIIGLFCPFVLLPYYFLAIPLAGYLKKVWEDKRWPIHAYSILIALIFVILENIFPQQFPAHGGHGWLSFSPFIMPAKFLGAAFYSFLNYWLAIALLRFLLEKSKDYLAFGVTIITIIISLIFPIQMNADKEMGVRIVQANIGNYMKIQSEQGIREVFKQVINFYREQSLAPFTKGKLDLIVWPETAYPKTIMSRLVKENPEMVPGIIQEITKNQNAEMLIGSYDDLRTESTPIDAETDTNGAFFFNNQSELQDAYSKIKLIPFGEQLPLGPLSPLVKKLVPSISSFKDGERFVSFKNRLDTHFISPICYEILFAGFMRSFINDSKNYPSYIVNLTNDSWYGDTMEPYQHKFLAHWRAIEFGIPIVRSTNTGVTSVLFQDGSESDQIGIGKRGHLDVVMKIASHPRPTFYSNWGLGGVFFLFLLVFGLSFLFGKTRLK